MRRQGITSFLDAAASPTSLAAFTAVPAPGRLTARAHFAPVIDIEAGRTPPRSSRPARDEAPLRPGRDQAPAAITLRNAKLFMDGVQQYPAQTAGLLKPYLINAGTADAPSGSPARPAVRSTSRPRS